MKSDGASYFFLVRLLLLEDGKRSPALDLENSAGPFLIGAAAEADVVVAGAELHHVRLLRVRRGRENGTTLVSKEETSDQSSKFSDVLQQRAGELHAVEALAPCVLGGVPLGANRTRLALRGTTLAVGDRTFVFESLEDDDRLTTRELAFKMVATPEGGLWPTIVVVEGPHRGRTLVLQKPRAYTVGRADGCDLVLDDATVSRVHLDIELVGEEILVRDRGAKGGAFLGTSRLDPGRPAIWSEQRGVMLRVGHVVLGLVVPPSWSPSAEPMPTSDRYVRSSVPPPSTRGESIPSMRIATSACEASIADVRGDEAAGAAASTSLMARAPDRRARSLSAIVIAIVIPLSALVAVLCLAALAWLIVTW